MRRVFRAFVLVAAIAAPSTVHAALSDNLVACWDLDSALTESINGYTLTNNNSVGFTTGKISTAADFDGATNWLSVADNANLSGGNSDFTIVSWVWLDDLMQNHQWIGKGDGTGYEYTLQFNAADGRLRFRVASGAGEANATEAVDGGGFGLGFGPSTGEWVFVVGWHNSVTDEIGIATSKNWPNEYKVSYSSGVWDSTGDFAIGRPSAYFPSYLDGRVDEVSVFRRVLTSGDRDALYNGGSGLSCSGILTAAPSPRRLMTLGAGE